MQLLHASVSGTSSPADTIRGATALIGRLQEAEDADVGLVPGARGSAELAVAHALRGSGYHAMRAVTEAIDDYRCEYGGAGWWD